MVFAAYAAFQLIDRMRAAGSRPAAVVWLGGAGLAMGLGVWVMQVISVLALESPLPIRFDPLLSLLSAGAAVVASVVAFHLVCRRRLGRLRFALAGTALGVGVGFTHYIGLAALSEPARIFYDAPVFAVALAAAVVLSSVAIALPVLLPRSGAGRSPLARLFGAAVMGLAIAIMQSDGMLAVYFVPGPEKATARLALASGATAAAIGAVTLLIVGLALLAALYDRRVHRAEGLLLDAVAGSAQGVAIYDRDDRLLLCNDAYRRICGASAGLLVPGMRFEALLRDGLARGRYLDARGREEAWLAGRLRRRAGAGPTEQRMSNGTCLLIDEQRMADGGIACTTIDITAMTAAQAALRDSEQRLDRAQEIAGMGSWEYHLASGRLIWSRQMYRLRGLTEAGFAPRLETAAQLIHPEDRQIQRDWLARLAAGGPHEAVEFRILRRDGEIRRVAAEGRPVAAADGTIVRLAGTLRDVTELRRTEEQLAQAQKMETIGQLTGGLAHDFNNILGAVIGNLDLLGECVAPASRAARYCREAQHAALSGAELVRRLLAFARRQTLRPMPTDIAQVLDDVLPLATRTSGERIAIVTCVADGLWPAVADAVQLESAVLNLVVNARDAMPDGGTLTIAAANVALGAPVATAGGSLAAGDYVAITVADTGTGMAPEVLARAFEPFFTTKAPGAGTGLGLSMVFGTMQQLGGAALIDSAGGRGTSVCLYLPRAPGAAVAPVAPEADAPPRPPHVLLVEEDAEARAAGCGILRDLGYAATAAGSTDAAMTHIAHGTRFDLLVTEVLLPAPQNAIALARALHARHPAARVLFTSAFPDAFKVREQIDLIDADVIPKPYGKMEFARAVHAILTGTPETVA